MAPVESMPPVPCASASFASGDLGRARLAAELADGFDDEEHAAHPRMAGREPAAVGVRRQRAVERESSVLDERAALPLRAEPEVLERDQHGDRERVVELEHVDVVERDAGPLQRERARSRGGRSR